MFMNKVQALIATLVFWSTPLLAQETIHSASAMIGEEGLSATEEMLAAIEKPTPEDLFVLGGIRFLGGVERAIQTRWKYGITTESSSLPLLRMPIPSNPDPDPFEPQLISDIFRSALEDMAAANEALTMVGDVPVKATLNLDDIWLDLNGNGIREPQWENVSNYLPANLGTGEGAPSSPLVTFDSADVAWLQAYTHLISGMSSAVLAYDPTDAIKRIGDARAQMMEFGLSPDWFGDQADLLDYIATVVAALDQEPDAELLQSGHSHMLKMVGQNRIFWQRVAAETDDSNEWIPSDSQSSALGLEFPEGIGNSWLEVLTEIEEVLEGKRLIPHELMGNTGGINFRKVIENPAPIDVLAWLHGIDALPYYELGPRMSGEAWWRFNQLVGRRNGFLFAVLLN